jgi:hypothetical protein
VTRLTAEVTNNACHLEEVNEIKERQNKRKGSVNHTTALVDFVSWLTAVITNASHLEEANKKKA